MRFFSWLGTFLIVFALAAGATMAHLHADTPKALLASTQQVAASPPLRSLPYTRSRTPRPTPTPSSPSSTTGSRSSSTAAAPAPRPAAPRIVVETTQQALINQDRARNGLGPLTWSSCLYSVALANARRMAAQGYISHTNGVYLDLACRLGSQSGENVGYDSAGVNDSLLNTDFMNSPEHRANILGPYHYVATAWVVAANGYGYIAVEFD
jgi:uncharacterized protein YkwD